MSFSDFIPGGGEMGQLIRKTDWSKTPLGGFDNWPNSLKVIVSAALENKIGMYIAWGPEFTQIYNDAYRPILGNSKHPHALGLSTHLTFKEIWHIIGPMFIDVMEGNAVGFPDFMLPLDKNGDGNTEECYFDFSYSPIRNEENKVAGVLVTVVETTEKVRSLKNIKENEERYQFAIDAAELGTWDLNPLTHTFEANKRLRKWFGLNENGPIPYPISQPVVEEDQDRVLGEMYKSFLPESGGVYNVEYSIIDQETNQLKTLRAKGKTTFNNEGVAIRFNGILEDITSQTQARKALVESESNLSNLVMNAPVAMCVLKGKEHVVQIANDPMFILWGKTKEEVMNKPIFEGLPEAKEQGLEALLDSVFTTGIPFFGNEHPVNLPRLGGIDKVYVNFVYQAFREGNGAITGIIAVAIEVTDQVNARHKVEEAEERARLAVEGSNIGTFDVNLETEDIISSDRFNNLFGIEQANSMQEYVSIYHPDDLLVRENAYKDAFKNGSLSYQARLVLKDDTIKWIKVDGRVFYNADNKPIRLLGTALDITSSIDVQRQKDDFLAIASHELKTPLTSIKGYTQILSSLVKKGDQVTSLNILKKTERQVNKMTNLIHNFLDISKLESSSLQLQPEQFDLNDLISETINYFNLPENKERLRFIAGKLDPVFADRAKMGHVIDNFISNAIKYSPPDQLITVASTTQNNEIIVSVKDKGIGINNSSQDKIFQRFFRADNVKNDTASGFGIGLYLSSEVIKLHKGRVWFESKEGEGSTFYFSLPVKN